MFKKILVPLDGSELAAKILPQVIDLATTHQSQVTLLHVYYAEVGEATPGVIKEAVAQEAKRCELFLAQAAASLEDQGVKASPACVEGSPPREIIVVDSGSTDGTREVARGSGARVEDAPCPLRGPGAPLPRADHPLPPRPRVRPRLAARGAQAPGGRPPCGRPGGQGCIRSAG